MEMAKVAGYLGKCALAMAVALPLSIGSASVSFSADDITIGVAMKTQLQRRWAFDEAAMKEEAKKQGVKLVFQWANDDPAVQASQVENLLSQGVKALVLVPVDNHAAAKILDSAHQAGVPIVSYDASIPTAKADFTVQRDSELVGEIQAKGALKMVPKGNYALLKGDAATSVARDVEKSYNRILKPDKDINIVFEQFIRNYDPKLALAAAENVLSAQNDKVDAFVVTNDGMASGVAQALKERNLAGKVYLSGLDADTLNLRLIAQGVQTLTVWTDLDDEGSSGIKIAAALARGQKPDVKSTNLDLGAGPEPIYLVKVTEVNKDNLCDFIVNLAPKGWVTVKDVFDDPSACK
jgi:D-xylose transport system substrate-binding protein